jgi:cytosine/creatinine deaminase
MGLSKDPRLTGISSSSLQAEMSALENAGRLPASAYQGATMYTTLSPCDMCTGACIMYKVKRVVIGENKTFLGGEDYLKQRGIEVVNLKNQECEDLMKKFIAKNPAEW